ncbi:ABC transporter ATP-binding protein [Hwanghaeella grinnelliae]|uniref:Spermidine/putrescine import ATP-binding protein PotA n=1 Tax=Hwanghaeella grinnelliae TaxID=2500179 RepID=A0A437QNU6_9PROT|nr:ABC transporter ATP-binding protein [Hwanghaeella grinnelliae]RVU36144.1 ABC transporter ATP-binding protein [Hwanghaeella grinnelliae]
MTDHAVELKSVVKRYGDFTAVHDTNLGIPEGSFLTLLGPSGCGKTTTLRMIAGLTGITEGDILIKGRRVNDLPIHKRNLGIVFQNYALFPHRTVQQNVAFGLKYRNTPKDEAERRVREALELVQLPQMADRMPSQLSGGQQQRIALARAIVIQPDVLLLDEPLSALDANLREDMRIELKRIQHTLGITTVFVTHDQSEALAMSDRIVVMSAGHVEQVGSPEEVYNRPASEFVAGFLGNSNILSGKVMDIAGPVAKLELDGLGPVLAATDGVGRTLSTGETVKVSIRAEKLMLDGADPAGDDISTFPGTVTTVDYQGQVARYFLESGGLTLQAINTIDERPLQEGTETAIRIRARDCVVLPH